MTTGKGMIEIIDWLESAATWIDGHPDLDCDGDPEGLLLKTWNVGKLREAAALLRLSETPPRQETPEDQSRSGQSGNIEPLPNAPATKTVSDVGLSLDMTAADRLRDWANLLLVHGNDISYWGDRWFVISKMQIIATEIEHAVRDIGILRKQLGRAPVLTAQPAEVEFIPHGSTCEANHDNGTDWGKCGEPARALVYHEGRDRYVCAAHKARWRPTPQPSELVDVPRSPLSDSERLNGKERSAKEEISHRETPPLDQAFGRYNWEVRQLHEAEFLGESFRDFNGIVEARELLLTAVQAPLLKEIETLKNEVRLLRAPATRAESAIVTHAAATELAHAEWDIEPPSYGWRRWAWVDGEGRLSIMKANATREEVAELGEPDERLIRVQITEVGSGNQTSMEHAATPGRSAAHKSNSQTDATDARLVHQDAPQKDKKDQD